MTSQAKPVLGWIGLGSMGLNMAKNLQKHLSASGGPALNFTNRTLSRGVPLVELGGVPCATITDVVSKSDIIFSSGRSGNLNGKIMVDTSTVHPDTTVRVSKKVTEAGATFVSAPVSGASPVAEAGKLLFIVAGPTEATEAIAPYLKGVMGREVINLGEDVSKSSLMKTAGYHDLKNKGTGKADLVRNLLTASMMEMIAEAHVFAEKTGLGTEAMEKFIEENFGPLAGTISKRMTTGAYEPPRGGTPLSDLNLALKDVSHGITCAENAGTRLKIAEVALGHLKEAREFSKNQGGRPMDSSSMYGVIRRDAGLEFETDLVKKRDA
ncbi:6-phosphogluconate dehydrogenase family protein [Drepanopeziza brunnea f. sp. 'multigermtubi' MB_m1]|uniref:6-phosphogluconate dehydrogenase family protein n=1 Tax=Marssonina brunnea f. sp. multigermtubi (strain MB_m1) TaxID=1072389 RepID=K1Y9F0_MARBU|nr:6-phosphogluconate dehydrogenase family protein [Drepanopeziza brunnea f. sp. 'multigermtubi' MB_m1]EKD21799.1 6-phosphogluconate dehydrogenase family protein [Drepanopeziza brunnea f. sp. 'multigermtubi' MB_m1]